MDVTLYVYDLSQGLARQLSRDLLGIYIDAVYHTSIVLDGAEYFFGHGINTCRPGSTHFGSPIEMIRLGNTQLPIEVILEYVEGLKETYSPESYDLFLHNCNNFSDDFAMFLTGKGIPGHITSLPQTVLNTPFGQMLKPQLDQAVRTVTQYPLPPPQQVDPKQAARQSPQSLHAGPGRATGATYAKNGTLKPLLEGKVHDVTSTSEISQLLSSAARTCAIVFFTSSTRPQCKLINARYRQLVAEAGSKAVFIKVEVDQAFEIARQFNVEETPTFISFLEGEMLEQWSGANEDQLREKVDLLLNTVFLSHPHANLKVPLLERLWSEPVVYKEKPELDKLAVTMSDAGCDESVTALISFIKQRDERAEVEIPLPNLPAFAAFLDAAISKLPPETLFAAVDFLRASAVDARVSDFLAGDGQDTIETLVQHVASLQNCPCNLRLATMQLICNLSASDLWIKAIISNSKNSSLVVQLITTGLLDDKNPELRVVGASLAFNIAIINYRIRTEYGEDIVPESDQIEIAAALLETLSVEEESMDSVIALAKAIGLLVFFAPPDGELVDVCKAMDATATVQNKESLSGGDPLVKEIGRELLGKGLR